MLEAYFACYGRILGLMERISAIQEKPPDIA